MGTSRWTQGPFDLSGLPPGDGTIESRALAELLGVTMTSIATWTKVGRLPAKKSWGFYGLDDVRAALERHNATFAGLIGTDELAPILDYRADSISQISYFPAPIYKGAASSSAKYRISEILDACLQHGKFAHYQLISRATGMTASLADIGPFTWAGALHGRRDYIITCARCSESETLAGQNYGTATAASVLPKKFNQRGWRVGSRASKHICPACQQKTTDTTPTPHKEAPPVNQTREHVSTTRIPAPPVPTLPPFPLSRPEQRAQAKAEPPRAASIEERRIINAKLDDVYASKGYTAGWSDEAVAKDLNVPRAWVAQVREMLFGADINEDEAKTLAVCQDALNRMTQIRADMEKVRQSTVLRMDELMQESARLIAHARDLMTVKR